ncbi:MAG: YbjQ family protein [Zoogloeaceae bacterium]|jgi:uncharacterized protein YbjQ (UPF0145 family)|nr:YbjQ family protein [Zoogloeaceae bacterium]
MGDLLSQFSTIIFVVILMGVAFIFGSIGQSRHYRSIKRREWQLRRILVFNEKMPPASFAGQEFALVSGSVVMGSDHFRQVLAGLKSIFGGRLGSFETMLDRGRRESILRMKEQAARMGATAIFNVRLETSVLSSREGRKQGLACAELIAYGTAWRGSDKPHAA